MAASALFLSGCATHNHDKKKPAVVGYTPGPQRVGTVSLVNADSKFVLIDVGSLYTPKPGTALKSFANGAETGILAVGAEKQRPFIAADIIRGTPKIGDEVRE